MRVSQPLLRVGGVFAATAAIAIASLLHAPASTAEDLRAQVDAAEAQLQDYEMRAQAALEDFNGAKIHLQQVNDKLARTQQAVDDAKLEVAATQQDIGKFAASAYRSGGLDYNLQVFLADDPQQFLDQATVLGILADNQSASLRRSQSASLRLAQLTAELTQQQAEAEATKTEMAQRKQEADRLYGEMADYLAGLQAELRAQLEAERRAREEAARQAAAQAIADAAAAAAAAEAAQSQQNANGNGGSGNGGGSSGGNGGGNSGGNGGSGNGGGNSGGGNDWSGNTVGADRAAIAVQAALAQLGEPYDPTGGGQPPDTWDCSKLTAWAWGQAGVQLTPYSYTQATEVRRIDVNDLQPGDLLFFFEGGAHHASMYIGGGQVIEASSPATGVRIADLWNSWNSTYFTMAGRPYA